MKKTGKKLLALLLALMMLACAVPFSAFAGDWDNNPMVKKEGNYYYTVDYDYSATRKEACIVGADETLTGDIVVPDTLGGYPVTFLSYRTFAYNSNITSVVLPESVVRIGNEVFSICDSLESVTAKGAKYINNRAFAYSPKLTQITLADSLEEVGSYAFVGSGYYNDPNNWEDGVLYFNDCLVRCEHATSPEKCIIKDGTRIIAVEACLSANMKEVYMPDSVVTIGERAFQGCYSLEKLRLSESLTKIPAGAFQNCKKLTDFIIPENITEIDGQAFDDCDSLTEVRIPAAVKMLDYAFGNCSGVKEYIVDSANENYYSEDGMIFKDDYRGKVLICYPCGRTTEVYTLPSDVNVVAGTGFSGCESLKEVKLTDNCKDIGGRAFSNCISLEKVNFPKGIKGIGERMFYGCVSLPEVTIPDTIEVIGDDAFRGCKLLKTVEIPSKVTSIGSMAFYACPLLDEMIIKSGNVRIGYMSIGYNESGVDESGTQIVINMNKNLVIKGYKGSTAEQYALEEGITFVEIEPPVPVNPSEGCPCRCHKGGFENFIYKFLRIFWRLFRTHEFCECGVKHY